MKLPSVSQAIDDARRAFVRFPFVVLDAIIGTFCALILIDHTGAPQATVLFQIIFGAVFGFPLLAGLAITAEANKWNSALSLAAQAAGILVSAAYAYSVPPDVAGAPAIYTIRLVMLTAGWTLFTFSAPYLMRGTELGYWNFCKSLVMRVMTAYLYTVVLWMGLAIALAALDKLFGVNVPPKRYGELWVLLNGAFTTWFFLAGIPADFERLDALDDYPKGLKIFSQYILSPLVFLYLVILYAYLGKILLAWDWPEGWVSKLILGFIATGICSILLLHPIKGRVENIWIKIASRWFYVIIIPLIVMLFFAISRRVSEYGCTQERYMVIAAAIWLCVITAYFIISRKKRILFIPATLCVAAFVVTFGPWGMFAVSESSQVARLKDLLSKNKILVDGRVQMKHDTVLTEASRQISSIVAYLGDIHGFESIQPWFGTSLRRDSAGHSASYKDPASVAKLMGIEYVRVWQTFSGGMLTFMADQNGAFSVEGYERFLRAPRVYSGNIFKEYTGQGIAYRIGEDPSKMTIILSSEIGVVDSVQIDLQPFVEKLMAEYGKVSTDRIQPEKMTVLASCKTAKIKICLSSISIQRRDKEAQVISYEGETAFTVAREK